MFADLDEALRQLLVREVPLPPADIDIAFERPDRERVARFSRPTVDLFLFEMEENKNQRETGWQPARTNGNVTLRWPPLRVDLRYLVTVWSQNIDDEHELLYHLYRTLRRLPELPEDLRDGTLQRQPKPIVLEVEEGLERFRALIDLWGVLDNAMRPGLVLRATVSIDLNGVREAPAVRTSGMRLGPIGGSAEHHYTISGHVRNAEGAPVAGARVRVSNGLRTAVSDTDGAYSIAGISGPETDLVVEASGFEAQSRAVSLPGEYDVTLVEEGAAASGGPPRPRRARGGGT